MHLRVYCRAPHTGPELCCTLFNSSSSCIDNSVNFLPMHSWMSSTWRHTGPGTRTRPWTALLPCSGEACTSGGRHWSFCCTCRPSLLQLCGQLGPEWVHLSTAPWKRSPAGLLAPRTAGAGRKHVGCGRREVPPNEPISIKSNKYFGPPEFLYTFSIQKM